MKKCIFVLLALSCFSVFAETGFQDGQFVSLSGGDYVIGEGSQTYTAKRHVEPFMISKTEITYKFWYEVRIWAEHHGYFFQNPGQAGSEGLRGKIPGQSNMYQPVTMINWYDAVVWCNALSEKEGLVPCYVFSASDGEEMILRDSGDTASIDLCSCRWNADGYRLPPEREWEYAARRTKDGFADGSLVSGGDEDAVWSYLNAAESHIVGTGGTPFAKDAPPMPGSGIANDAGIFDMSGNMMEFCWDWFEDYPESKEYSEYYGPELGSERVMRGGSWNEYTMFLGAGDRYSFDPNEAYNYFGLRVVRSRHISF